MGYKNDFAPGEEVIHRRRGRIRIIKKPDNIHNLEPVWLANDPTVPLSILVYDKLCSPIPESLGFMDGI